MAYSENHADIFRKALSRTKGISEKKMFGGLCFLLHGNMLCGVHKDGGMARVGKDRESAALEIEGVSPLSFTGRRMGGMVEMNDDLISDPTRLKAIVQLAKTFVRSLPPK